MSEYLLWKYCHRYWYMLTSTTQDKSKNNYYLQYSFVNNLNQLCIVYYTHTLLKVLTQCWARSCTDCDWNGPAGNILQVECINTHSHSGCAFCSIEDCGTELDIELYDCRCGKKELFFDQLFQLLTTCVSAELFTTKGSYMCIPIG